LMVHICQPLTLIQENEELQADVAGLSKAYTRRFTRSHIMPFHGHISEVKYADKD